jgi:hypothetical protein
MLLKNLLKASYYGSLLIFLSFSQMMNTKIKPQVPQFEQRNPKRDLALIKTAFIAMLVVLGFLLAYLTDLALLNEQELEKARQLQSEWNKPVVPDMATQLRIREHEIADTAWHITPVPTHYRRYDWYE